MQLKPIFLFNVTRMTLPRLPRPALLHTCFNNHLKNNLLTHFCNHFSQHKCPHSCVTQMSQILRYSICTCMHNKHTRTCTCECLRTFLDLCAHWCIIDETNVLLLFYLVQNCFKSDIQFDLCNLSCQ